MTQHNLVGTTIGRFEVLSELGSGGMAVVYKARQLDLDRVVALKVLAPALTIDTAYITRFRQEARRAASLEHPHIIPIYDVGESDTLHYIAMKFVSGPTLKELTQQTGTLSIPHAVEVLTQVGRALEYAHRRGVIHRDIKPTNILVTDEDWVYLTDFGLARDIGGTSGLTKTGTVMGTPEYMSPEQAQGSTDISSASDIYALGVVLYEVLTGTFPFQADTPMGMLAARLVHDPRPLHDVRGDMPPAIESVVMRALARDPADRFPSAEAMVKALQAAAGINVDSTTQQSATSQTGDSGAMAADTPTLSSSIEALPAKPEQQQPSVSPFALPTAMPQGAKAQAQQYPETSDTIVHTIPTERVSVQPAGPRCPACDTLNPNDALFCVNCGRSLTGETSRVDPLPDQQVTSPPSASPKQRQQRIPPAPPQTVPPMTKDKGKAKDKHHSPVVWGGFGTGFFLIGLAILFITNTIWPGILVLLGISGFVSSATAGRPWAGVQSAFFMIGLAFLFTTNLIWPGILILVGISAIMGTIRNPGRRGW